MKPTAEWELIKLGEWWRFVNHNKKYLTVGWKTKESADFRAIRIDKYTIPLMLDRYQDYF